MEISKVEEKKSFKHEDTVDSNRAFFKYLFNMNVNEDWDDDEIPVDKPLQVENNGVGHQQNETFVEVPGKRGDKLMVSWFAGRFQKLNDTVQAQDQTSSMEESSADVASSSMEHAQENEEEEETGEENANEVGNEQNLGIPVETVMNCTIVSTDAMSRDDVSHGNTTCDTRVNTEQGSKVISCFTNDESVEEIINHDINKAVEEKQGEGESSTVRSPGVKLYGSLSFLKVSRNKNDNATFLQLEENRNVLVENYSNITEEAESFREDKELTKSEISEILKNENDFIHQGRDEDSKNSVSSNDEENNHEEQDSGIHDSEISVQKNDGIDRQVVQDNVESHTVQADDSDRMEKKTPDMESKRSKTKRSKIQADSKKKGTSAFTKSLHNALPWLDKQNKTHDADQKFGPVDGTAGSMDVPQNATSPMQMQQPSPLPSQGGPSSSLIFLSSPPLMRGNVGYPRGMPPSNTESTVAGLFHMLLPLLSRILLLTVLSSSALFGFGESNVYSPEPSQHFMLERLYHRYDKDSMALKKALEGPPDKVSKYSWAMEQNKRKGQLKKVLETDNNGEKKIGRKKAIDRFSRTVIVMDVQTLDRDMDDVISELRDAVSFILSQYYDVTTRLNMGKELEVIVCIESPGGVVQDFGLAADQLARLKDAGANKNDIFLTVCVDKIAASGGYMMACQASPGKLLAAPFAVLGSIGVLRETINIHDVLEKYGVQPLVLKAGDAKVPLTQTTKVTEESIAIVQKNLERAHAAFRDMVSKARGEVIADHFDDVTNGDIFLGKDAAKNGLVDQLMTSDEYIAQKIEAGDRVLKLHKYDRSRMGLRLSPLDLLLLKSNGLLGKSFAKQLQQAHKIALKFTNVAVTFGFMKVLDTAMRILSSSRQFSQNRI
jgi:serine protease SohB